MGITAHKYRIKNIDFRMLYQNNVGFFINNEVTSSSGAYREAFRTFLDTDLKRGANPIRNGSLLIFQLYSDASQILASLK